MDFGTINITLRQRGTAGRPKGDTLMPECQGRKEKARWPLDVIWLIEVETPPPPLPGLAKRVW